MPKTEDAAIQPDKNQIENNITDLDLYHIKIKKEGNTAKQLLDMEFPEPQWVVDGMLAENSFNLCGGKAKLGKSWLAIQMAAAVSVGKPFLGKFDTTQGKVIYLALEDTNQRLQKRYKLIKGLWFILPS